MPKKVVFLLYSKLPTGGLKVLFKVGNGLLQRGYDVVFEVSEYADDFKLEYENHCEVIHSPKPIPLRLFTRIAYLLRLKTNADCYIATYFPTAVAGYFNRGIRDKLIYYVQADETHFFSFRWQTFLRRFHYFALSHLSYVLPIRKVVNCEGSKASLNKNESYPVIPPGFDPNVYHPVERKSSKLRIGHISRNEVRKGSIEFFKAMEMLRSGGLDFELVIAYNKCQKTLGLEYEVIMPSNENELASFYASCDIVVSTVWEKGFAYPPLETMACGALSLSTPIDYGEPWFDHIPIEVNNPDSIAEAVRWVVGHPEKAREIRENGLRTSKDFHWDRIIDMWEKVING